MMKHFTWKVFFVFSNAFLINWISPNCAGSSLPGPRKTEIAGRVLIMWVCLSHHTFYLTLHTFQFQSTGNIVNIFMEYFQLLRLAITSTGKRQEFLLLKFSNISGYFWRRTVLQMFCCLDSRILWTCKKDVGFFRKSAQFKLCFLSA